jgi:hypothetical protein
MQLFKLDKYILFTINLLISDVIKILYYEYIRCIYFNVVVLQFNVNNVRVPNI